MQLTPSTQTLIPDPHQKRSGKGPADLWQRGQRGWPASYPILKVPNAPLIVAIVTMAGARLTSGDANQILTAMSRVAFSVWAYQELSDGGNFVRRLLGLGFLVYLVAVLATTNR